jgi:hypothetical protein
MNLTVRSAPNCNSSSCTASCVSICTHVPVKPVKQVGTELQQQLLHRLLRQYLYYCTSKASNASTVSVTRPRFTVAARAYDKSSAVSADPDSNSVIRSPHPLRMAHVKSVCPSEHLRRERRSRAHVAVRGPAPPILNLRGPAPPILNLLVYQAFSY